MSLFCPWFAIGLATAAAGLLQRKDFKKSLKLCKLSWTFEILPSI
jgi:hypothetical protein